MIEEKHVRAALNTVQHPKLKKSLLEIGLIRDLSIHDDNVSLVLALKSLRSPVKNALVEQIENAVSHVDGVRSVQVDCQELSKGEAQRLFPPAPLKGVAKVKHFLAVASGKGGVGKTTIAVNVALALARQGLQVGLLDADVYGPSVPLMLDITEAVDEEDNMIIPKDKYGMRVMSLGMTAGQNEAFIWRGPLVSKMIHQLLDQVRWNELDYLVIDLPPGTGDPSITIAKSLPHCSVLMITTPQEVALADVRRSITLFQKIGQPVIGLVENMAGFSCGHTAEPIAIFGSGGGEKLSQQTGIPLLGSLPLDPAVGLGGDSGVPLMEASPDSATGKIFMEIANQVLSATS